jgi:hypothetical protein
VTVGPTNLAVSAVFRDTRQLYAYLTGRLASCEAKQLSHGAYERIRNLQTSESELDELEDFQRQVCGKIPVPPGVTG